MAVRNFLGQVSLLFFLQFPSAPSELILTASAQSPYYTVTRYPDVEEDIASETAADLIKRSKKVVEWAKQRMTR